MEGDHKDCIGGDDEKVVPPNSVFDVGVDEREVGFQALEKLTT